MGQDRLFNKWCHYNWTYTCKTSLKMDHRPKSKTQTRKLLEYNTEENADEALAGTVRTF